MAWGCDSGCGVDSPRARPLAAAGRAAYRAAVDALAMVRRASYHADAHLLEDLHLDSRR